MSNQFIKKVAIVGGTHGNELTGVYLIEKFKHDLSLIQRDSFETITLLGNPKAIKAGRRYIDTDLNRCFKPQYLQNHQLTYYEQIRAKQIEKYLKYQEVVDVIIDLHTTTADMGISLILNDSHPFLLQLSGHLCYLDPDLKILQYSTNSEPSQLRNLAKIGLAIEVGPVPQGVLKADIFHRTEALIMQILDYIQNYNCQQITNIPKNLTLYKQVGVMDYPRDENNEIKAMIFPTMRDYQPLKSNDAIFIDFKGNTIKYQGNSIVYPVFVNESAYLEKGIAFSLTMRETMMI
ncbi:MAG: aspartoacylase [Crocosphaera sp.]|nr:aspartoacylase [Crocosphaera sp.]